MIEEIEEFIEQKLCASLEGLSEDDLKSILEEVRDKINGFNSGLQGIDFSSENYLDKIVELGVEINMALFEMGIIGHHLTKILEE